jgi:hypothetical protein
MKADATGDGASRVFPSIGPRLYEMEPTGQTSSKSCADRRLGRALLELCRRHFNPLQCWRGIALDPVGRVGRLFLIHRLALEAELAGRLRAADFFWRETQRQVAALAKERKFWVEVLARVTEESDAPLRCEPERLSRLVTREIILDTHRAFIRGYVEQSPQPQANSRVFVHLGYMRACVKYAGLDAEAQREILGPPTLLEISASERARQWRRAQNLAADLLRRFPEETSYQNALAATYLSHARATLTNGNSPSKYIKDAASLARFMYRLKKLRLDYPHNLFIFDCIAEVSYLRAEKLAAAGQLAESLTDVQAALTYRPDFAEAEELRARLEAEMQQIRIQMAAPAGECPDLSKRQLKVMQRQAARGFRLMESYKRSEEARAAVEDLAAARARRIWENIGLESLAPIDHRPLALVDTFETICHAPPVEPAGIPAAWSLVSEDNPHLSCLNTARIYEYLNGRLFGAEGVSDGGVGPQDLSTPDNERESAPAPLRAATPRRGGEPLFYWLASGENKWLKFQCVLALILVLVGGRLAIREHGHRAARETAYRQIHEARARQDYKGMLDAAESFLGNPIIGTDSRAAEVEGLYSEALLRWFVIEQQQPDNASPRLERYRRLLGTNSKRN